MEPTNRQLGQWKRRDEEAAFSQSIDEGELLDDLTTGRVCLHEVGHLKFLWEDVDCVDEFRKITAAADRRDGSAGAVHFRPPAQNRYTRAQLKSKLQLSLGGRAAEEVFFTRCVGDGFDRLEWPKLATKLAETSDEWTTLPLGRRTRGRLNALRDGYIDRHLQRAKDEIRRDKKKVKKVALALFRAKNMTLYRTKVAKLMGQPEASKQFAAEARANANGMAPVANEMEWDRMSNSNASGMEEDEEEATYEMVVPRLVR
ncbi:hypothetical protein niasHS_013950 [Heterodera schachtii]|uniref:Peptidase M41 domain-containing protein n=2 Tax=Heterodera TaxID=34509 RepID=A0ABD2J236_HETSC